MDITPFKTKSIFIWSYWASFSGNVEKIAQSLVDANFECAYVHTNDGPYEARWDSKVNCTPELVQALRSKGLKVIGWGAPYGINLSGEIQICAYQTRRYNLDGYIFDAEGTFDKQPNSDSNAVRLVTEYQKLCPNIPVAWCWWPFYENPHLSIQKYHPVKVLWAAMQYCDIAMPMAYWSWGDSIDKVNHYLEHSIEQYKKITQKPIVVAGRSWRGDGGVPTYENTKAYDMKARELGSVGISWWDYQHALNLPDCWKGLCETPKFNEDIEIPHDPGDTEIPLPSDPDNGELDKMLKMSVQVQVLNVRSGPGKGFSITSQFNYGDTVFVHDVAGKTSSWVKISESEQKWCCVQDAYNIYLKKVE